MSTTSILPAPDAQQGCPVYRSQPGVGCEATLALLGQALLAGVESIAVVDSTCLIHISSTFIPAPGGRIAGGYSERGEVNRQCDDAQGRTGRRQPSVHGAAAAVAPVTVSPSAATAMANGQGRGLKNTVANAVNSGNSCCVRDL